MCVELLHELHTMADLNGGLAIDRYADFFRDIKSSQEPITPKTIQGAIKDLVWDTANATVANRRRKPPMQLWCDSAKDSNELHSSIALLDDEIEPGSEKLSIQGARADRELNHIRTSLPTNKVSHGGMRSSMSKMSQFAPKKPRNRHEKIVEKTAEN